MTYCQKNGRDDWNRKPEKPIARRWKRVLKHKKLLNISFAFFLSPLIIVHLAKNAYANPISALVVAAWGHTVFGNAIIGVFEGIVLAKCFDLSPAKCIPALISANYFSHIAYFLIDVNTSVSNLITFHYLKEYHTARIVISSYVFSNLLEWPFVAKFCFDKKERWSLRSIRANLLIQSLSYILITAWYWYWTVNNRDIYGEFIG